MVSKKDITKVITIQCIDFCEVTTAEVHAVLQRVASDLRGGTFRQHPRALVATLCFQENPHRSLHILHAAMFQILRGAYILLPVLSTTEYQEAQELLVEIQQQPGVFVLKGPAVAITNVGTASGFLADGWSTESVCRVVRAARAKQENNGKETRTMHQHSRRDDDFRHFSSHGDEHLSTFVCTHWQCWFCVSSALVVRSAILRFFSHGVLFVKFLCAPVSVCLKGP